MKRAQLVGLVLTAVLVLVLVGSLIAGMRSGGGGKASGGAADSAEVASGRHVQVEVLNAAGTAGLARDATERLRDAGFDVVYYGNADSFGQDSSIVLDRVGRVDVAKEVGRAIGIDRVQSRPDSTLYLDATVIIGRDWSGIPAPPADSAAAEPDS
ncbi:MAG TPA: LytR C-terminal domain-containing protein [Longimicrobiaceae bacterium]|nr:LytR C-terminal domain-containing protein [Longimicrobiaceae bacterium]